MTKPLGFYCNQDCVIELAGYYGDLLEQLTANDKLGLIAAIALWLADDSGDWDIPTIAHTELFPESQNLSRAVAIIEDIEPREGQGLIAALIDQLYSGVYAK